MDYIMTEEMEDELKAHRWALRQKDVAIDMVASDLGRQRVHDKTHQSKRNF